MSSLSFTVSGLNISDSFMSLSIHGWPRQATRPLISWFEGQPCNRVNFLQIFGAQT
jgi:hypothetical protein